MEFNTEIVMEYIDKYRSFGPLPGVLLPVIESFFPPLPLMLIIFANASAYGLWLGFLYSWLGAIIGSSLVYLIVRKFSKRLRTWILKKKPNAQKQFDWIKEKSFTFIFLASCLPFAPSSLINLISGITNVPSRVFFTAIILGKGIMILAISYIGRDIVSLITNPIKLIFTLVFLIVLWFFGKLLEKKMDINKKN